MNIFKGNSFAKDVSSRSCTWGLFWKEIKWETRKRERRITIKLSSDCHYQKNRCHRWTEKNCSTTNKGKILFVHPSGLKLGYFELLEIIVNNDEIKNEKWWLKVFFS